MPFSANVPRPSSASFAQRAALKNAHGIPHPMTWSVSVGQIILGSGLGLILLHVLGRIYLALAGAAPIIVVLFGTLLLGPGVFITVVGALWWLIEMLAPSKRPPARQTIK